MYSLQPVVSQWFGTEQAPETSQKFDYQICFYLFNSSTFNNIYNVLSTMNFSQ